MPRPNGPTGEGKDNGRAIPGPAAARTAAAKPGQPEKVQATRLGYYGHMRRRPGAVFAIRDGSHFSARWMRRVPPDTPETSAADDKARQEHAALIEKLVPPKLPTGDEGAAGQDRPTGDQNPLDV